MCCLFTWMAWCFDASHRLVVFIMACLISSSVCCLLLIASLAGVAMGYNYSLAEYIDLKETNISVYIKRGVYDDEISDDFDWRRSAGGDSNANIELKDHSGLRTEDSEGLQPLAAGRRRSDNSVFESDDQNKYEGGLMRLTSTQRHAGRRLEPPEPPYTTSPKATPNLVDNLLAVADNLPGGSLERLKAIQAAARHHEAKKIELATAKFPDNPEGRIKAIQENAQIHDARRSDQSTTTDKYDKYFNQLAYHPGFPGSGLSARKFMESNAKDVSETKPPNRFRDAVFRGQLSGWPVAGGPKPTTENFFEYEISYMPSMPTPLTVKPLLVRPLEGTKPVVNWDMKQMPQSPIRRTNYARPNVGDMPKAGRVYSDYDESHGLPVRKKRSEGQVSAIHESSGAIPFSSTKIRTSQNYLPTGALNAELELSMNTDGALRSDIKLSTEKVQTTELPQLTTFDNSKSTNSPHTFKQLFLTSDDDDNRDIDKQPKINDSEHLTTPSKTKKKKVHFKPRKRMESKGYKYKTRGNTQTKSIWWRISDGAQEQWHRIIMYLCKYVPQVPDNSQNPQASDKSALNSYHDNRSTLINKLVTILTKKRVDHNNCGTTETNMKTNLETSTEDDHSRFFKYVTK